MTLWFLALGLAGLTHIADDPGVLAAFNPAYAVAFLATHGIIGLVTLGAVFLAVTGAEALYADLGHFGRKPIQTAWLYFVLPALASTISVRARSCCPTRRRSPTPSTGWCRHGRSIR